jgi:hypothetical protein
VKRKLVLAIAAAAIVAVITVALPGCSNNNEAATNATQARQDKAAKIVLCGDANDSLECKNLKERERRNSQPSAIGYVYLYNFDGSVKGYFTIKGKVSSTQSQMGAMDIIADACLNTTDYCPEVMEAAGDDGSFGPNESGIFFFTTEGVMVTYSGEYVLSDGPLKLSENKLN